MSNPSDKIESITDELEAISTKLDDWAEYTFVLDTYLIAVARAVHSLNIAVDAQIDLLKDTL